MNIETIAQVISLAQETANLTGETLVIYAIDGIIHSCNIKIFSGEVLEVIRPVITGVIGA